MSVALTALVLATALAAPAPPLKCTGGAATIRAGVRSTIVPGLVDPKNPVTIVDEVVYPDLESATADLPRNEVESVDVVCWDGESGEFRDDVGLPVVRVVTKTGWENRPDTPEAREAAQASALARWFRDRDAS